MNPTPQLKRFVGSVILMVIIAIIVPFFISGENVNKGREAIALLSNSEIRDSQRAIDNVEQMQRNVQEETQKIDNQLAMHDADIKSHNERIKAHNQRKLEEAASSGDPVIVENKPDPAVEAELRRQRELEAKVKAEKERKAELMRQQQQLREREAQLQAEKQRRIAEAKAKADKQKAEEKVRNQNQTITVINANTNKKTEIEVKNAPAPAPTIQENKASNIVGGDKYTIKVGTFSSITNAKNAQAQVRGVCSAPMLKPVMLNGQRMFKVTCGVSKDINQLRATQNKLTSIVGQTALEKVN